MRSIVFVIIGQGYCNFVNSLLGWAKIFSLNVDQFCALFISEIGDPAITNWDHISNLAREAISVDVEEEIITTDVTTNILSDHTPDGIPVPPNTHNSSTNVS